MIRQIRVKNFKSFDDLTVTLNKVNVLVGPNGSGKSNFVDLFLFLKGFVKPQSFPPYPFTYWGGYKNLVYMNDDNLNVEVEIQADEYYYRFSVNGKVGLKVLEEDLKYKDVEIKRKYNEVEVDGKKFNIDLSLSIFHVVQRVGSFILSQFPIPSSEMLDFITKFGNDIVVLRIDPYASLSPVPVYFSGLMVNGFGLPKLLFTQLPKLIQDFLDELNLSIKIDVSPEGNFIMYLIERIGNREVMLHPSSIPSGVIKMLTILGSISILKPYVIVIDEVENSLHLNFIERLIDIFNYSEPQVIMTTHSPMVIDLVDPKDVLIVDKEEGKSVMRRFKDVNSIKNMLKEKGLLLSEYLLYS
ncbi:MAG: AAA family ATPase [Stygiolobus sp.]|jgi:predicted ATPase|nr:AAA family ATPase [Stygiolobus sp.]